MTSATDGTSSQHATRTRRMLRTSIGILTIVTASAVAGAAGVIPAVMARKTFLAPEPDAGLGDLGPALFALAIGFAGFTIGAAIGCVLAVRALRRVGMPTPAVGVIAVVVVGLPSIRVLFLFSPMIAIAVLGVVVAVNVLGWFRVP